MELVFPGVEGAGHACRMAETVLAVVWYTLSLLPFAGVRPDIAAPWNNPERRVKSEDTESFRSLWTDYQNRYRLVTQLRNSGRTDPGTDEKVRELLSHVRQDGRRFVMDDCSGVFINVHIGGYYYLDFFSMLCLMLAAEYPETAFTGKRRIADPQWYSKKLLTTADYDGRVLEFRQRIGDPGYDHRIVTWTEKDGRFEIRKRPFPYIRVDIFTDDREALRQDEEISQWINRQNGPEAEPASAELDCFPGRSCVVIHAPSAEQCERMGGELLAILARKGFRTGTAGSPDPGKASGTARGDLG